MRGVAIKESYWEDKNKKRKEKNNKMSVERQMMRTVRERIDPRRLEVINILEEKDTSRRR